MLLFLFFSNWTYFDECIVLINSHTQQTARKWCSWTRGRRLGHSEARATSASLVTEASKKASSSALSPARSNPILTKTEIELLELDPDYARATWNSRRIEFGSRNARIKLEQLDTVQNLVWMSFIFLLSWSSFIFHPKNAGPPPSDQKNWPRETAPKPQLRAPSITEQTIQRGLPGARRWTRHPRLGPRFARLAARVPRLNPQRRVRQEEAQPPGPDDPGDGSALVPAGDRRGRLH